MRLQRSQRIMMMFTHYSDDKAEKKKSVPAPDKSATYSYDSIVSRSEDNPASKSAEQNIDVLWN